MTALIECTMDFFSENEVAVSAQYSTEFSMDFLAAFLFCSYTLRQVVNIGIDHPVCSALGKSLSEISGSKGFPKFPVVPTNASVLRYVAVEDITFIKPGKMGNKRFNAKLVLENGITRLLVDAKGFGFLGKDINYYAPTSVFVLLTYLANHIYSIGANLSKFVLAATMCGLEINSGHLTMENQLDIAYRITKVATES